MPRTSASLFNPIRSAKSVLWAGALLFGSAGVAANAVTMAASASVDTASRPAAPQPVAAAWITEAGKLAAVLLVAILVVAIGVNLVRRRRRQQVFMGSRSVSRATYSRLYAPLLAQGEPGWTPIGANPNEQGYWNGQGWTARRRWSGAAWVELSEDDGRVLRVRVSR